MIPIRLDSSEQLAVSLALQMALAWRARATLLHVVPHEPASHKFHWLAAIDALHDALSDGPRIVSRIDQTRAAIADFVRNKIDDEMRALINIDVECRVGDIPTEVARFADGQAVDLVILYRRPSPWRLPLWPGLGGRIARLTSRPVALLHFDPRRAVSVSQPPHANGGV